MLGCPCDCNDAFVPQYTAHCASSPSISCSVRSFFCLIRGISQSIWPAEPDPPHSKNETANPAIVVYPMLVFKSVDSLNHKSARQEMTHYSLNFPVSSSCPSDHRLFANEGVHAHYRCHASFSSGARLARNASTASWWSSVWCASAWNAAAMCIRVSNFMS